MLATEGAIEGAGEEGAFAGKEGMPKDELEPAVLFSDEIMLDLAWDVGVWRPKGFSVEPAFPSMLVDGLLPESGEKDEGPAAALLPKLVKLVCAGVTVWEKRDCGVDAAAVNAGACKQGIPPRLGKISFFRLKK